VLSTPPTTQPGNRSGIFHSSWDAHWAHGAQNNSPKSQSSAQHPPEASHTSPAPSGRHCTQYMHYMYMWQTNVQQLSYGSKPYDLKLFYTQEIFIYMRLKLKVLKEINWLFMELVNLENVAKDDVLAASNSVWQLATAVCHVIHVTLQTNTDTTHCPHNTAQHTGKMNKMEQIPTTLKTTKQQLHESPLTSLSWQWWWQPRMCKTDVSTLFSRSSLSAATTGKSSIRQ